MNFNLKQGSSIERAALFVSITYASILFVIAALQRYLFGTQVLDIGFFSDLVGSLMKARLQRLVA